MAAVALPVAGTLGSCVGCMMLVEKLAKFVSFFRLVHIFHTLQRGPWLHELDDVQHVSIHRHSWTPVYESNVYY
jgi:hypothetical protein